MLTISRMQFYRYPDSSLALLYLSLVSFSQIEYTVLLHAEQQRARFAGSSLALALLGFVSQAKPKYNRGTGRI